MPYTDRPSEYASPRLFPDLTSFPRNEMGEPLMDGAAYRFEQALDAESADDPGDYYDRMDQYDISDHPDYCDYHDAIHHTAHAKRQCRAEQDALD